MVSTAFKIRFCNKVYPVLMLSLQNSIYIVARKRTRVAVSHLELVINLSLMFNLNICNKYSANCDGDVFFHVLKLSFLECP